MNALTKIYRDSIDSYLAPLRDHFRDDSVSEIMVNSKAGVFVEQKGCVRRVSDTPFSERRLRAFVCNLAELNGHFISDYDASYQGVLPQCGSRFHCIWPPATSDGAMHLTIRKHKFGVLSLKQLHRLGAVSSDDLRQLETHIKDKSNIIICGETGTGKTTMLNALLEVSNKAERIVVIEDIPEIEIHSHPNKSMLRSVPANEDGRGHKTIRDLVRESLIMRPDRIILGECRGVEAVDLIQAMQTHRGCLATLHGRSIASARYRLETLMLQAQDNYSAEIASREIESAVDLFVLLSRGQDGSRYVSDIQSVHPDQ